MAKFNNEKLQLLLHQPNRTMKICNLEKSSYACLFIWKCKSGFFTLPRQVHPAYTGAVLKLLVQVVGTVIPPDLTHTQC